MSGETLELFVTPDTEVVSSAVLSEDRTYRYLLTRGWGPGPRMLFVMLNPSTADAEIDDPTIRRCIGFAKREGCGGLEVVNLFAYRATEPDDLLRVPDPVGVDNEAQIGGAMLRCPTVVVAWGAHKAVTWQAVGRVQRGPVRDLWCLGHTKNGSPRHPLYVHSLQPLLPWSPR